MGDVRLLEADRRAHSVKIHGYLYNSTWQNATQFTTMLSYQPMNGLDMGDMYALLISGILGTLMSSVNFIATLWSTECMVNLSLSGRTVSCLTFLLVHRVALILPS